MVLFAALVVFGLGLVAPIVLAVASGALGLSFALAAGLVRRPGGYVVGSVLQVPLPLAGLVLGVGSLVAIGVVFGGLWVVALQLGGRIDRERAERAREGAR